MIFSWLSGVSKRSAREIACGMSNMNRLIKFLVCWIFSIVGVGFFVIFLVSKIAERETGYSMAPVREMARAPEPVNQNGLNLVRNIIIYNILVPVERRGSGWGDSPRNIYDEVVSKELSGEYSDNEYAADQKYKGKRLIVSGTVQGIRKGVSGAMVLELPGKDRLMGVQAELASKSKGFLGVVGKGGQCRACLQHQRDV